MAMQETNVLHSGAARIVALLISVLMFALIVLNWPQELKDFAASFSDNQQSQLLTPKGVERIADENPGRQQCLAERVGHVDQMLANKVINERQHEEFASRARNLCLTQFPSP